MQRGTTEADCVFDEKSVLPPIVSPELTERGRFVVLAPDAKKENVPIEIEPSSRMSTPSERSEVETEYCRGGLFHLSWFESNQVISLQEASIDPVIPPQQEK